MSFWSKFRRWLSKTFTVVGAITCLLAAIVLLTSTVRCATKDRVPDGVVLELRLERELPDGPKDPLAELMGRPSTSVLDIVEALERAASDDRVVGLVAHVGAAEHGVARVQEVREAIIAFRESGKFAIAFAETFGEMAPSNQGYDLATAFDEIWLQPSGSIGLTGFVSTSTFLAGTLEKLDVQAHGDHRKEYKNAYNMFTERRFTPAHREATQAIVDDTFGQLVSHVAQRRGKSEDEVRRIVDEGPHLAKEALEHGLVDALGYRDDVMAKLEERLGRKPRLLYLERYLERAGRPYRKGRKIALVQGIGPVVRGGGGFDPFQGDSVLGSDTVAGALRAAIDDDDVEAIVFRVDSPGGSAVASDTVWREVVRAKEAGKPVVVTMGNVAGSGGYYVACAANKIVAQPGTITGSIGVLGGKPVTRALWNRLGVTFDEVSSSKNATFYSGLHRYDDAEWARLQAWLDRVYEQFKERVAQGRGMTEDEVEAVAKGRIWSGARAKELGLVDELGGYATALRLAREEAGIAPDAAIELAVFPRPKTFFEQLLDDKPDSSEDFTAIPPASRMQATLTRWQSLVRTLESVGLSLHEPDALSMPPVHLGP
jgi:protease IV